jgi:membrane protein implicated in regulation of membrane protease activity
MMPVLLSHEEELMDTWLWLMLGAVLCFTELVLPTAFVAFMMGLSALIVALVSPVMPQFYLQALLWLGLSTGLIFFSKRFMPQRKVKILQDSVEAQTLTEILPGQKGRVLYEGISWQARCDDHQLAIAADEKVYVVRREGTTLIVMPESIVHS